MDSSPSGSGEIGYLVRPWAKGALTQDGQDASTEMGSWPRMCKACSFFGRDGLISHDGQVKPLPHAR